MALDKMPFRLRTVYTKEMDTREAFRCCLSERQRRRAAHIGRGNEDLQAPPASTSAFYARFARVRPATTKGDLQVFLATSGVYLHQGYGFAGFDTSEHRESARKTCEMFTLSGRCLVFNNCTAEYATQEIGRLWVQHLPAQGQGNPQQVQQLQHRELQQQQEEPEERQQEEERQPQEELQQQELQQQQEEPEERQQEEERQPQDQPQEEPQEELQQQEEEPEERQREEERQPQDQPQEEPQEEPEELQQEELQQQQQEEEPEEQQEEEEEVQQEEEEEVQQEELPQEEGEEVQEEEEQLQDGPHQANPPQVDRRQGPQEAAGHQGLQEVRTRHRRGQEAAQVPPRYRFPPRDPPLPEVHRPGVLRGPVADLALPGAHLPTARTDEQAVDGEGK